MSGAALKALLMKTVGHYCCTSCDIPRDEISQRHVGRRKVPSDLQYVLDLIADLTKYTTLGSVDRQEAKLSKHDHPSNTSEAQKCSIFSNHSNVLCT